MFALLAEKGEHKIDQRVGPFPAVTQRDKYGGPERTCHIFLSSDKYRKSYERECIS